MFRLSKLAAYATVLMACLSQDEGGMLSAQTLAERTRLEAPTVSKLLKQLAQAGLVASTRGAAGGYRLARPAASISIADIIAAIEGPLGMTECSIHTGLCGRETTAPCRAICARSAPPSRALCARSPWSTWPRRHANGSRALASRVDDLLATMPLVGLSRDRVHELLGAGDGGRSWKNWDEAYLLGPERGMFRLDSKTLVLRFGPDGLVSEYRILTD